MNLSSSESNYLRLSPFFLFCYRTKQLGFDIMIHHFFPFTSALIPQRGTELLRASCDDNGNVLSSD